MLILYNFCTIVLEQRLAWEASTLPSESNAALILAYSANQRSAAVPRRCSEYSRFARDRGKLKSYIIPKPLKINTAITNFAFS